MRNPSLDELFTVQDHFTGKLKVGRFAVGTANADLFLNEFDTNNMAMRLSDARWRKSAIKLVEQSRIPWDMQFVSESRFATSTFNFRDPIPLTFDTANMDVTEYRSIQKLTGHSRSQWRKTNSVEATYYFPFVPVLPPHSSRNGLELNAIDWSDDLSNTNEKKSNCFISESTSLAKLDDDGPYHAKLSGKRSRLTFDISLKRSSLERLQTPLRERAKIVLSALSLLEGDAIHWKTEDIFLRVKDGYKIARSITHRWAMPPSERFFVERSRERATRATDLLSQIVVSYLRQPDSKRTVYDNAIRAYQLACRAEIIETQFLAWHACLDLWKKVWGFPQKGQFTRELKKACAESDIPIADLQFTTVADGRVFRFTDIRNRFLHDGLFVEDILEMVDEARKMKALTERFILKWLGIDYRTGPLGVPYV